jgi:hypothetical protein
LGKLPFVRVQSCQTRLRVNRGARVRAKRTSQRSRQIEINMDLTSLARGDELLSELIRTFSS